MGKRIAWAGLLGSALAAALGALGLLLCDLPRARAQQQAAAPPTPPSPPFHRFIDPHDQAAPWDQDKAYVGEVMRDILFAPATSGPVVKAVDDAGCIRLDPQRDFPPTSSDAVGLRVQVKYVSDDYLQDQKRKKYLYFPNEDRPSAPFQVRPPGKATRKAEARFREVFPEQRRHVTRHAVVPPDGWLDVAVGLQQDWRVPRGSRVRVAVAIESEAGKLTLHEGVVAAAAGNDEPAWTNLHLDLTAHAGRTVRFAFTSAPAPGAPAPNFACPLWGTPLLYSASAKWDIETPNVILISLDTLRADHVGCYGYARETTPNLDRFAEECVLFETAVTSAPWTTPSHASVFTGLHPAVHGAGIHSRGFRLGGQWNTLAEVARSNGYLTTAFTEGIAIRGQLGFAQGFDIYSDGPAPDRHIAGTAEQTFARAAAWLDRYGRLPFFLFVHTYEIHEPYGGPGRWRDLFTDPGFEGRADQGPAARAHTVDLYDGGIAYTDEHLGRFLDALRQHGLLRNTAVVVFSDHGEEFWEHGAAGHLTHLYDEVLLVPLLIRLPGDRPPYGRVRRQVALRDVFATVLEFLGMPAAAGGTSSLLSLAESGGASETYPRRWVHSELVQREDPLTEQLGRPAEWTARSVRTEAAKYVASNKRAVLNAARAVNPADASTAPVVDEEFYDLLEDPVERENAAKRDPKRTAHFRALNEALLGSISSGDQTGQEEQGLTEKDIEALKSMGYL